MQQDMKDQSAQHQAASQQVDAPQVVSRQNKTYALPFDVAEYSYEQSLAQLKSALRFGIEPLLETVQDMLAELGNPDSYFSSVQIAGTNGKTSTARYTASLLHAEGYKTALYTSPELVEYPERMEIDGRVVSPQDFAHGIAAAIQAGIRVNQKRRAAGLRPYDITEFDTLTVAAMVIYAEKGVQVAVLECGMGGRWDATSAVNSIKSVAITGIGLDHMHILGDTLEAIAGEKAAIIKTGRTCVLGVGTATPASVEDVFLQQASAEGVQPCLLRPKFREQAQAEMHEGIMRAHPDLPASSYEIVHMPQALGDAVCARVTTPRSTYTDLLARKPSYQVANFSLAIVLCEQFLGRTLDEKLVRDAIMACPTPGRFDVVRTAPLALVDACHNPQSVQTFLGSLTSLVPDKTARPALLCAALADKDVNRMVALFSEVFDAIYVTQTTSPRALAAIELADLFVQHGKHPQGVFANVEEACKALSSTAFVACGSITLAGEVVGIMRH